MPPHQSQQIYRFPLSPTPSGLNANPYPAYQIILENRNLSYPRSAGHAPFSRYKYRTTHDINVSYSRYKYRATFQCAPSHPTVL